LDNILINGDGHLKVADFGLSKLGIFDGCKIEALGGTSSYVALYMAPEVIITLF
jgi:serine/threonine protein kinase